VLEERGAQNLRQLAVGIAPEGVHLPEPVLGGHIALGQEEIVLGGRLDVEHAVGIAADRDRSGESGEMNIAVHGRQRGLLRRAKPQYKRCRGREQQHQQPASGPTENAQPAKFTAGWPGFTGRCGRLAH